MKTIPNFPNYAVTKDGKIWSKKGKGKWLSLCVDRGYLKVDLCENGKRYLRRVHCLVLITYVGKCPKGMECRHLDGNRQNNKLSNLKWGTSCENSMDAAKHGTRIKGEGVHTAKLTEQKVRLIIDFYYENVYTLTELAKCFNVTRACIANIVYKRNWKHLWQENKNI